MIEVIVKKNFNIEGGHVKGDVLTLDVCPTYTCSMLKAIIRTMWDVPVKHQRLKLNEK